MSRSWSKARRNSSELSRCGPDMNMSRIVLMNCAEHRANGSLPSALPAFILKGSNSSFRPLGQAARGGTRIHSHRADPNGDRRFEQSHRGCQKPIVRKPREIRDGHQLKLALERLARVLRTCPTIHIVTVIDRAAADLLLPAEATISIISPPRR